MADRGHGCVLGGVQTAAGSVSGAHAETPSALEPEVPVGKLTTAFRTLEEEAEEMDIDLRFVINDDYTEKMRELAPHAKKHASATSEPAYGMLQILGHLRGGEFSV
jgi:hypothetical protein